jgi:hypothetical protein
MYEMKRHRLVLIGLLLLAVVGFHIWNLVFFFGGGVCRARRRFVHFSEVGHCKGAPLVAHHSSGSQLDLAGSSSFARPVYDLVTFSHW